MNYAKIPGWGLLGSIALAVLSEMSLVGQEGGYMLAGLGFVVFGIWGGILLVRVKQHENNKV